MAKRALTPAGTIAAAPIPWMALRVARVMTSVDIFLKLELSSGQARSIVVFVHLLRMRRQR